MTVIRFQMHSLYIASEFFSIFRAFRNHL